MANILLIDDDPLYLRLMGRLLQKDGHGVYTAGSGRAGLTLVDDEKPDLVITDCQMPEMTGLEVITALKDRGNGTPVILMTAHGDESVVLEAFRRGAINYVSKTASREEMLQLIDGVLSSIEDTQARSSVLKYQVSATAEFDLDSTIDHVHGLVSAFIKWLDSCEDGNHATHIQMGMALTEALNNAIIHGNLGVSSKLKEDDDGRSFQAAIRQREADPAFRNRRVRARFRKTPRLLSMRITDQGPGFDTRNLPDPEDPENFFKASGRGILMMRSIFDDVVYNHKGNEVLLLCRLRRRQPGVHEDEYGQVA